MVFDVGAGLANMGQAIATYAGQSGLLAQREQADQDKMQLANTLAMQRQTQQQTFEAGQNKEKMTFEGGQNDLNRQSAEKRTEMTTNASIASASITAKAHLDAARLTADAHLKAAETYAGSRELVAQIAAKAKTDLKSASLLSDDAVNSAANYYNATGELPPMGFGGQQNRALIINKAAELRKQSGLTDEQWAANKGSAIAAKTALNQISKQSEAIAAFSSTADKNAKILLELSDKVDDTGNTVLNRWIRGGRKSIVGDPDVAAFDAAMQTYIAERAKILSGAMGNQAPTDASRNEVSSMMNNAMTRQQIAAVDQVLGMETMNRLNGFDERRKTLLGRLSGKGANFTAPTAPAAAPSNPQASRALPLLPNGRPDPSKLDPNVPYTTNQGVLFWHPDTQMFEATP